MTIMAAGNSRRWIEAFKVCLSSVSFRCGNSTVGKPVDETDVCCFIRSQCYQDVSRTYLCNPKTVVYGAQFNDGKIKCIDACESCTRDTCQCDKRAAECFKRHTLTYNATYNRIDNKQYCRSSSTKRFDWQHTCGCIVFAHIELFDKLSTTLGGIEKLHSNVKHKHSDSRIVQSGCLD